mmetsp:Transcript_12150/g.13430  ORF Transcript_12150/g.13430 Transcript_12150/m.13430 type:complete len:663 (+) Transcript_12150:67-2055(+)
MNTSKHIALLLLLLCVGCSANTFPWATLEASIGGNVLLPGDPRYHNIRDSIVTLNDDVPDDQPLAIVQPSNPQDVRATILFAKNNDIPQVTALAGGHNGDGFNLPLNGIQLQFSLMTDITINPANNYTTIEPGVLAGNVTAALAPLNRGHPVGNCNSIGATGYLSVGGFGFWTRLHGMGVDVIVEYELVTAAGDIVIVNKDSNPELFFALRGALPAYGIATKITLMTFDTSNFFGGYLNYRTDTTDQGKHIIREWYTRIFSMPDLIDNKFFQTRITPSLRTDRVTGLDFFRVLIEIIFLGPDSVETKKAKLRPLVDVDNVDFFPEWINPDIEDRLPVSYFFYNNFNFDSNIQLFSTIVTNFQQYRKHGMISEERIRQPGIFDAILNEFMRGFNVSEPSSRGQLGEISLAGKRVAEIPRSENAFYSRDFGFLWSYSLSYRTAEEVAAARVYYDPFLLRMTTIAQNRGFYGNYNSIRTGREFDALGTNIPRLERVKGVWDPTNMFSRSWAIAPGVGSRCVDAEDADIRVSRFFLFADMEIDSVVTFGDLTTDSYVSLALYNDDLQEIALFDFEWWSNNWTPKTTHQGVLKKWKYRDGLSSLVVSRLDRGEAKLSFRLFKNQFTIPHLPIHFPLYMRVEIGTKECLQATFSRPSFSSSFYMSAHL